MSTETNNSLIEKLLGAGAHFGFSRSRRHPTVTPYLYGNKHGTDIFDLEKTSQLLEDAKTVLREAAAQNKTVLFVGTKDEVSTLVERTAQKIEMPYVVNRWIGGMLTNFSEIKKRIERMKSLELQGESGELERKYTKKERVVINREREKLSHNFGGLRTLERTPQLMVVVDPRHDSIAIKEAAGLRIPIIGVTSSDGNLAELTYPVLVNDALQASVSLTLDELAAAYTEGLTQAAATPKKTDA